MQALNHANLDFYAVNALYLKEPKQPSFAFESFQPEAFTEWSHHRTTRASAKAAAAISPT